MKLAQAKPDQKFINPSRFKLAATGQGRTDFRAYTEVGTTLDDVLNPDFWGLVASEISRGGAMPKIEVIADDLAFYAELLVIHSGSTYAKVAVLNQKTFSGDESTDIEESQDFKVVFKGPVLKHCVVNNQGVVVSGSEGKSKIEAYQFLKDHISALSL